jgi:hypothetical protein
MDDSLVEVHGIDDAVEEEVLEIEDGLTIRCYQSESGARFLDLDWEPGSKWEFLETVEPEFILESLLSELFSESEADQLLEGVKVLGLMEEKPRGCGCDDQAAGQCEL